MLGSGDEKPGTTTPVMMLIAGSATSSRHLQRDRRAARSTPSGRSREVSSSTGRTISSSAKKRRNAP